MSSQVIDSIICVLHVYLEVTYIMSHGSLSMARSVDVALVYAGCVFGRKSTAIRPQMNIGVSSCLIVDIVRLLVQRATCISMVMEVLDVTWHMQAHIITSVHAEINVSSDNIIAYG
jgi:hypothetical protein